MSLVNAAPRTLGAFSVGPISYGLWRYTNDDLGTAQGLIEAALDSGMNLIDTSDVYGFDWGGTGFGTVEDLLGNVLAAAPGLRDRMVLATKGGIIPPTPYDSGAEYLRAACEDSLRRLQTDVVDVYQIHRPDMFTHPAEVAATLAALRDEGKIREVGVSNYTPDQYDALAAHLPFPMVTNQPEYSVMHLQPLRDGTLDRCMRDGVVPLAWSPLGGGRLFASPADGGPSAKLAGVLDGLAEREGVDRAAIAVAFVLAHPSQAIAIVGTQNLDRIAGTRAALEVNLDRADVYAIVQASEGVPLP
ncbi:MAG: aldo/keto reductase [Actinomycetota bacterium]